MKNFHFQTSELSRLYGFIKRIWDNRIGRIFIGGMIGASAGWLYWEFIGCNGGSCPLTSSAPQTIIIFSLFGMWYNYRK
jgi:hypothetical protein